MPQGLAEQVDHTVEDLRDLHPTDQEGVLGDLLKDAGKEWWVDKDAQGATLERSSVPFNSTPRAEAMREIDADEERLGAYPEGLLGVYLRNRLFAPQRRYRYPGTARRCHPPP